MKIAIINGPNLNLLGKRETDIYGNMSFVDYLSQLRDIFPDVTFHYYQSNVEGELINELQRLGFLPCFDDGAPLPIASPRTPNESVELLSDHRVRFTHPAVKIDLGGIAKGFAVDRALATLRACGVPQGLVNAGGDVAVFGPEAVPVHVRDPRQPGRTLLHVEIRDEAIASSANAVDRSSDTLGMAMIIDPGTRRPATAIHGATVRAPLCVLADALTKLVILAGQSAETLLAKYDARALLVPRTGDMFVTQSWAEEMRPAP